MYNLLILSNENEDDHYRWVKACENFPSEIRCRVVDITLESWLEEVRKEKVDYILAKPGGNIDYFKQLYDERLRILHDVLGYKVYPTLEEILIYENKRYFSYWLSANNIPHPKTRVFYHEKEAIEYVRSAKYPIVAKLNIGASGNGVSILRDRKSSETYISRIFREGISAHTGPRIDHGKIVQRAIHMFLHPKQLKAKLKKYKNVASNPQRGFCIFQEFIVHTFEWRVVRIGESFFAHKKLIKGEKTSGSLLKGYENPPLSLLDFVRNITEKHHFHSQAVDIFEIQKDTYLVNEMQCIFGQSDPYQMLKDGKPGRYFWSKGGWAFEEGMFNTNESYDLRLQEVISLIDGQNNSN